MALGAGEYVREVEARFLELEGRGFALSAQDVGRVLAWHADGVPLRVVLSALEEADRKRRSELTAERLTLGRLTRAVESAMKRRLERVASPVAAYGAVPPAPALAPSNASRDASQDTPWRALEEALGNQAELGALVAARAALAACKAERRDVWQAAEEVDRLMIERLTADLSEDARAELMATLPPPEASASEEARAERHAFLWARALRERFAVPELVSVLLGGGR